MSPAAARIRRRPANRPVENCRRPAQQRQIAPYVCVAASGPSKTTGMYTTLRTRRRKNFPRRWRICPAWWRLCARICARRNAAWARSGAKSCFPAFRSCWKMRRARRTARVWWAATVEGGHAAFARFGLGVHRRGKQEHCGASGPRRRGRIICLYLRARGTQRRTWGALLTACARAHGGKGGGKPDFAQGGGPLKVWQAARAALLGKEDAR